MILIGQYDSPFVRRVAIALTLYEIPFEQNPWSVWTNAEEIAQYNPLRRVPTLVLPDGEWLIESFAILETLDELVGPERALLPAHGPVRRDGLQVCALATGVAEKAVSLLYELLLREVPSPLWCTRCGRQISDALTLLNRDRAQRTTPYWLGEQLSHADIAVACALRFVREAHAELFESLKIPALRQHSERCESLPVFQTVSQPLTVTLAR
ncbi:MAG TPA: glutathione S-transferase family protein [Polyangiaceae bacterium]|nr:glutathione S-transferase family protein [Polyangiaceae bacterium]